MKSAFAAIVGRPSAGKSTLLNALCGHKVSIVSPVPQTTRNQVRGILLIALGGWGIYLGLHSTGNRALYAYAIGAVAILVGLWRVTRKTAR